MILQMSNVQSAVLQTASQTGLWVQSSFWDGVRMKLPCTHFQQILNHNQIKFSVVHLLLQVNNDTAIHYI